jgi:nucleoside-diphosphate-sugar epimerase
MKKILVTGASGFIGQNLCKTLLESGRTVVGAVRSLNSSLTNIDIEYQSIDNISSKTKWKDILTGKDCIIHCAAKAHITNKIKNHSLHSFRSVNSEGTKHLAEQAAEMGVRRLIFLSSIGVNGLSSDNCNSFLYSDNPNPITKYAISKYEAEQALIEISSRTFLETVIIRSPLVYGASPPGNLKRLIKLVRLSIPLPFDGIKNKRSFIGIENLIDLIIKCIDHPKASGKTFLASDGEDLSTPELIKFIASSMGRKANLFPFPISILKFLGSVFGRREEINRLVGSLRIDSSYTKKTLNWTPPISVEEGIRRMVQGK